MNNKLNDKNTDIAPQQSDQQTSTPLIKNSKIKILIPILIGLGFVGWMFFKEMDRDVFSNFHFSIRSLLYLLLAFLFMAGRDLGYVIRLMLFARGDLTWIQALRVIMLWEFTSAITPSTVGGTSVAVVFVHKEGLSVGKSASMVMLTAFFDELFFVILFPIIILVTGSEQLFGFHAIKPLIPIILVGYALKLALVVLLSYGLFFNAIGFGKIITTVFRLPVLRRWKESAQNAANDIKLSSDEIKNYNTGFWIKAFAATSLSWTSRFLVANAIFLAFFSISEHLLVFARQLVMWIPMIISPTPGGSGFAEYIFKNFLGDISPVDPSTLSGTTAMIALLWRGITYYPYLLIGAILVPRWISNKFSRKQ